MVHENKNATYHCIGIYIFKFSMFVHDEVLLTLFCHIDVYIFIKKSIHSKIIHTQYFRNDTVSHFNLSMSNGLFSFLKNKMKTTGRN